MAPLGKAISVWPVSLDDNGDVPTTDTHGEEKCYSGVVDSTWLIGSVPNGGYVLGQILQAAIQFQSTKPHVDLLHVMAHFLRTTDATPFTVRVRSVKTSGSYTNLTADLFQKGMLKIMTHCIFGVNGPHPKDTVRLTLNPPSPYARRHPIPSHPSTAKVVPMRGSWGFQKELTWTEEPAILARNAPQSDTRTNASTVGGGGLEWGSWLQFNDKEEKITTPSLAFLADTFLNSPTLLPKSERKGLSRSWFPTMTLAIEFKNPIPAPSNLHADRTVGLYSSGNFITEPQARHEIYLEVWTAPSNIGEGAPTDNWRDHQVCLATATQMAIAVPMEVNERNGKKANSKL